MYLQQIHLTHYRNYENQEVKLNPGINVLIGSNGQGKTNFLEAVYYLACGNNFRGNKDIELIQLDQPYFRLQGQMKKDGSDRCYDLEIYFDREKNKQLKINGAKYKTTMKLHDYLRVVLFSPDDLKIIKGSPAERRRYLDGAICQLDRVYAGLSHDYDRVVQQRNNLLRHLQDQRKDVAQLEIWNRYLVDLGSQIIYKRLQFLKLLAPIAKRVQQRLTRQAERFTLSYHSSIGAIGDFSLEEIRSLFTRILMQKAEEEILRGATLWGPHRDDLIFYLNGVDLRRFGSQGQQRTVILSLKMAELETFYRCRKEYPLLLLDDVMSELDDDRRRDLLEVVKQHEIQTLITMANIDLLAEKIAQNEVFLVKEGKIILQ